MNFENDVGASLDQLRLAGRKNFGGLAGRVSDEEIAGECAGVVFVVLLGRRSFEEDSGFLAFEVIRPGLAQVRDDVVHYGTVRGTRFRGLYPCVFGESGRNDDVLIFDHAGRRHLKWLRQLKDDVGLGHSPAFDPSLWRRHVFRVAFRRARIRPGHDGRNFLHGKGAVVGEVSDGGVRVPGRHDFLRHHALHTAGPGPGLFIGEQRERSGLARAMATLAVLLQNRSNIMRKSRRGSLRNAISAQADDGSGR